MGIRVVLGEDSLIVRESVQQVLELAPEVEVVASCGDADSVLREVEARGPDVLLTDIRMPPSHTDEGIRLAAHLREAHPDMGVVVLSDFAEPTYALALFESGLECRAYLLKEHVHDRRQLVAAIEAVANHQSVVDRKLVRALLEAKASRRGSQLSELTPRELEVLSAIAEGNCNAAISDGLGLTKRAVEKHINAIFLKLRLSDSADEVSARVKAILLFLADSELQLPELQASAL